MRRWEPLHWCIFVTYDDDVANCGKQYLSSLFLASKEMMEMSKGATGEGYGLQAVQPNRECKRDP